MKDFVKTKIVATIGPASSSEEIIKSMLIEGVWIFRINSSHGTEEEHKSTIEKIRQISSELNLHVAVLLDLQGPKVRIGKLNSPITLTEGVELILKPGREQTEQDIIPIDYENIIQDMRIDEIILLDDGKFELIVIDIFPDLFKAVVIRGGILQSRKGFNVPGSPLNIPAVTEQDIKYIKFAVENQVDYIALSFVRTRDDITLAKKYISEAGGDIHLIAKIERPQAVSNFNEIIKSSDGIMIARGDLGIEMSPEQVPIIQKKIIKGSNIYRKPVITATQMLESMIEEPIPTRAEASDVANAIIDGTDAIMLSGETAVGKYPLGAVNMMKKIAQNIEKNNYFVHNVVLEKCGEFYEQDSLAIVSAVVNMLSEAHTDAIITLTKTGYTAKLLSKAKPDVPIVAISDNESVCRRMALFWGVFPYFVGTEFEDTFTEGMIKKIDELLMRDTFLEKGDSTIIVGSLPGWASVRANFLRIHQIGSVGII